MENVKRHPIYTEYGCDEYGNVYSYKFNKIRKMKTPTNSNGYNEFRISLGSKKSVILMRVHRFVYETHVGLIPKDKEIDHKDRNTLNNHISNLRCISHTENVQNGVKKPFRNGKLTHSQYKGVTWCKSHNCWQAQLKYNKKRVLNEYFTTELEAAKAYDREAIKYNYPHNNLV